MVRQVVDVPFDITHRKKMPAHIQVHAPVGKARRIGYYHARDSCVVIPFTSEELRKCLKCIEDARGATANVYLIS